MERHLDVIPEDEDLVIDGYDELPAAELAEEPEDLELIEEAIANLRAYGLEIRFYDDYTSANMISCIVPQPGTIGERLYTAALEGNLSPDSLHDMIDDMAAGDFARKWPDLA